MTTGEIIKLYRIKLGLSQEELGGKLGVNKAAVQKWESGKVENLKRSTIKSLADLFEITPCKLMGWEENSTTAVTSLNELVQEQYGTAAVQLLVAFASLNELGQEKVIENVSDCLELSKYTDCLKRDADRMA